MVQGLITVSLPTQRVTFRPGGEAATFEVIVRNDSDRQAQFQLELLAAGADPRLGLDWYQLRPEVSVAKPPGDETRFQVYILNSPLPDFIGEVNLTVKVLSPQIPGEVRRIVRLTIEPGATDVPLSIRLLTRHISVYPNNTVDIPVEVRNLTHQPIESTLVISALPAVWMINGTERLVRLSPKASTEITFQCQPPSVKQSPSQSYPFRVEAQHQGRGVTQTDGILEVLPVGFVKFAVTPERQSIPPAKGWLPNWTTAPVTFQAGFENLSNLAQRINIELQGADRQRCTCTYPQDAVLGLGETAAIPFAVGSKRPWLGLGKTLRLEAVAQPRALNSVDVEPATQAIELRVLPLIPLWLLLALLALLLALLLWLLQPSPIGHTDFVNAVRFSSDALSVVSSSDDCTIRRWTLNGNRLSPEGVLANAPATTCNDQPLRPQGVLALTQNQAVLPLEFFPRRNDRVAAGLSNGTIELWNLPTRQRTQVLSDPQDTTEDRVFALAFTEDAGTLLSGHGSGKIRIWTQPPVGDFAKTPETLMLRPNPSYQVKYQVRSLALSQDGRTLVSSGSKNTLVLWDLTAPDRPPRLMMPQESEEDYVWDVTFASGTRLLAASDSKGFISLWNLDQCQPPDAANSAFLTCPPLRRWRAVQGGGNIAVRSVRFSPEGDRLVSADDTGRVVLWTLAEAGNVASVPPHQLLFTSPLKVSTVDLVEQDQDLLVVSGGDDRQVKLHRIRRR